MIKLLMVTPNAIVYDAAVRLTKAALPDVEVIQTTSKKVVEAVTKSMEGCTGIVVARGNQAQLLKRNVEFPVSEIIFSGQEMAGFVKRACDLVHHPHPKIAFIGFHHMYSDVENIGELAQADIHIHYAGNSEMVAPVTENAIRNGAEVIIGSENACEYAAAKGIPTVFVDESVDCLRDALRRALLAMDAIRVEQRRTVEFTSLLNYSFDAILKLDARGRIEIVNTVAENVFHCPQEQLIGKKFTELPDMKLSDMVTKTMTQQENLYASVVLIRNERYLMNIACIDVQGQNFGYILTLYAFGTVDTMQETIRQEHVQQGDQAKGQFSKYQAKSPKVRQTLEAASRYAPFDLPILIIGESGTQRLRLAESIHNESLRRDKQFIRADLSVMPLESQTELLFGRATNNGLMYNAHKGTLYIQHIELLTQESQHQLLNVILNEQYYPPKQSKPTWASVRIIASVDEDLEQRVQQGTFSPVLLARLKDYCLRLPPIRECPEDLPRLIDEAITEARIQTGKPAVFTPEAMKLLLGYSWPGNHRELQIFLKKAFLLTLTNRMDADFVSSLLHLDEPEKAGEKEQVLVVSSDEERELRMALHQHHYDREAVMAQLGISRATLYRRMKKYGIKQ